MAVTGKTITYFEKVANVGLVLIKDVLVVGIQNGREALTGASHMECRHVRCASRYADEPSYLCAMRIEHRYKLTTLRRSWIS